MERLQRKFDINKIRAEAIIKAASELMHNNSEDRAEVEHCSEQFDHYYMVLSGLSDEIIEELASSADAAFGAEEGNKALLFVEEVSRNRRKLINFQQKFNVDAASITTNTIAGGHRSVTSKLPRLELPKFRGDPLKWTPFWDAFESSIHTNTSLSQVEKFNYLNSLLQGPAADATTPISVTNDNYLTAVDLIKERFGKKEIIISAHVDALLKIPAANGTVASLRKVYDLCEIHVGGLRALGIGSETYGVIVAPIILSKLPEEVKLVLTRKSRAAVWNLDDLRVLLQEEVENREWVSDSSKVTSSKPERVNFKEPRVTANLVSGVAHVRCCVFCKDQSHPEWNCNKVTRVEDRLQKAKEQKLCFNCLRPSHSSAQCKSSSTCRQCHKKHHTSLCYGSKSSGTTMNTKATFHKKTSDAASTSKSYNQRLSVPAESVPRTTTASAVVKGSGLILQTATMYVANPESGEYRKVRVVFDQGSHRSFVRERVYTDLGLKSLGSEDISIGSFRSKSGKSETFSTTMMMSYCVDGSVQQLHAVVVPDVIVSLYRAQVQPDVLQSFGSICFADTYTEESELLEVDILIGVDQYWEFVTGEVLRGAHGLIAMNSKVGWLLSGHDVSSHNTANQYGVFLICDNLRGKDQYLERLWKLEAIGVTDKDSIISDLEEEVLVNFNNTIEYKDGRYQVCFPWNGREDGLTSNYELCRKRVEGLIRRLRKTGHLEVYNDVIADQMKRGFIEKVESPEERKGVLHYIPHHPVIRMDHVTTKLRIVYDCSAKPYKDGLSLNDCLYKGVSLIDNLASILLRFRCHEIALIADIEKAFLQIKIREADRDSTRFLWLSNPTSSSDKDKLCVYRFQRVLFGASASPFLLAATVRYHLEHSCSSAARQMLDDFYVDNLLTGTASVVEAVTFYHQAKELMQGAGMNLREWLSNSDEVIREIPVSDRMKGNSVGVLGLTWSVENDNLQVKQVQEVLSKSQSPTKRDALRVTSLIFDPLGFISPVTIQGKILLQELWLQHMGWDDQLSIQHRQRLLQIVDNYQHLNTTKVPRRFNSEIKDSQLHVFVDASVKAYAAVAYLVGQDCKGNCVSSFVMSKARVAPIKELTLPKLELMAAYLGAEMGSFIQKSIRAEQVTVWSDSQITLSWIRSKKPLQQFVRNRVRKMKEKSFTYRYCPSSDNIADLPSRGCTIEFLGSYDKWLKGPDWLTDLSSYTTTDSTANRDQSGQVDVVAINPITVGEKGKPMIAPFGIDETKYSSYLKLMSITSYCMRFIKAAKRQERQATVALAADELAESKSMWESHIQKKFFKGTQKSLIDQLKKQLRMFQDKNGLIRCRGRIDNADVSYDAKYPKFLPKGEYFARLLVRHIHEKLYHQGVRHVVYSIRQEFWIPHIRQLVKTVLKSCYVCKLWDGPSYQLPDPPPLPPLRVTEKPPFSFTGCDFAGPLYHRTLSKEREKCYVCIFTCAVTRAVHLELVSTLSAEDFLLCLKRFISRRGKPIEIVSDNAKTFVTTNEALKLLWEEVSSDDSVLNYIARQGIKWKFNVPRAPWWGGFFERLVKSVKISLKKAIGRSASLDYTKINTLLVEIEAILNSRPLTFVYSELDSGKALCPSDFQNLASSPGLPTFTEDASDPNYAECCPTADVLVKKLQRQQRVLEGFWRIWRKEYLTSLQEFHRYGFKSRGSAPVPGDVVLLKEDIPRGQWKRGIIVEILPGRDGLVRGATIKVGERYYQRPINLLVPLELQSTPKVNSLKTAKDHNDGFLAHCYSLDSNNSLTPNVSSSSSRPRREAAIRALSQIRKTECEAFECSSEQHYD